MAWSKCFPRLHKRQQNYGLLGPLDKVLCEKRIHPGRRLMDSKQYVQNHNVILNASMFTCISRHLNCFTFSGYGRACKLHPRIWEWLPEKWLEQPSVYSKYCKHNFKSLFCALISKKYLKNISERKKLYSNTHVAWILFTQLNTFSSVFVFNNTKNWFCNVLPNAIHLWLF